MVVVVVIFMLGWIAGSLVFLHHGLKGTAVTEDVDGVEQERPMTSWERAGISAAGCFGVLFGIGVLLGIFHLAPSAVLRAIFLLPLASIALLGGAAILAHARDLADDFHDHESLVDGLSEGLAGAVINRLLGLLPGRLAPFVVGLFVLCIGGALLVAAFGWDTTHESGEVLSTGTDAVDFLGYIVLIILLVGVLIVAFLQRDGGFALSATLVLVFVVATAALAYVAGGLDGWVRIIHRLE
jgi:hypothetical protein